MVHALFASVFVIAACGLAYELIAGALASYLLGDSVLQFSTIIGVYLFAMGIGSYLSRFVTRGLVQRFIEIEIIVGLLGGFSVMVLMMSYAMALPFRVTLYLLVLLIGVLVGLEIPLLIRILKDRVDFRHLVSQVLTLDYIGALIVSILFPLLFMAKLGLARSALMFGIANVAVALVGIWIFRAVIPSIKVLRVFAIAALLALTAGFAMAQKIYTFAEDRLYADEIVLAQSSRYQRIILTKWKDDLRLYLNNQLQFSSRDEYRYHESLVHPGLAAVKRPRHVLVLGGGDGLAVREILKDPRVERVTLVDLDSSMTSLFQQHPQLVMLNEGVLSSPKVRIINADAFVWLDEQPDYFDFIVADFPDPGNYSLGKLYTTAFYKLVRHRLNPGGLMVVQATSPLFARKSFWSIEKIIREGGLTTAPYHVYVPSFGEWGFVIGSLRPYERPTALPLGLKFLSGDALASMFDFPPDMGPVPVEANYLNTQNLVHYYEAEWAQMQD